PLASSVIPLSATTVSLMGNTFHDPADDLGWDTKGFRYPDDIRCNLLRYVEFHPVPHIKDLVHFLPAGAGFFLDKAKQGRNREQVVLDHMDIIDKVQDLGLRSAAAMHDAVDLTGVMCQDF